MRGSIIKKREVFYISQLLNRKTNEVRNVYGIHGANKCNMQFRLHHRIAIFQPRIQKASCGTFSCLSDTMFS